MAPASVTIYNAGEACRNMIASHSKTVSRDPKLAVGDLVRVTRASNVFRKGYMRGWTLELFKIVRISTTRQPPVYFLQDLAGEDIDGLFYEEELSRVQKDLSKEAFEVGEILKTSGRGEEKRHFVSWKGYPEKFNSWVAAGDIQDLK
ncbi:hypothetical protein QAD02_016774 [Eretmocerus hayati]|uniref:Uncharacterized protein n=1 Tax=Eretmocerus hayati TaxID=131215 RepID=A0ACC2PC22_9HYME|nr:hypothetical protein QAD02_016774 [Eretmocerus hayati]